MMTSALQNEETGSERVSEALTETGPPEFQGPGAWRASVRPSWLSADASLWSSEGLHALD